MPGYIPQKSLTIGGRTFVGTEVDNLIVLKNTSVGNVAYTSFRQASTATGAAVTGGYLTTGILTIWAWEMEVPDSGTSSSFSLTYGDNDITNSATVPTNSVPYTNLITTRFSSAAVAAASSTKQTGLVKWVIPAGKILHIFNNGSANATWVTLYGVY